MMKYTKEELSEKRLNHTLGVVETAKKMSKIYKVDELKVIIGALLHDLAKERKVEEILEIVSVSGYKIDQVEKKIPKILHGRASAIIAKKVMKVDDEEILNAIIYHTTGKEYMNEIEKIIYISDAIEPGRSYEGMENIKMLAYGGEIDKALIETIEYGIKCVIKKGDPIHLDTIKARNSLL